MKITPLTTATLPPITSTVGALSDRELLRETRNLVRHERHLQGAVIDHLAEIEARGLYLQRGFSSLFDYAVRELGYSDAAAARRIGAMRLCADQPDAREGLRDGSLTLSAAAELQWAFDRQRRRGSISGTAAIAPAIAPAGTSAADSAPAVPLAPAEPEPPPLVLDAVGRQKLVEEAAGKSARQVRRMLADLDPELAPPADRVRPLGDGGYELKATIDAECQQGLEQLRGLLSHVDPRHQGRFLRYWIVFTKRGRSGILGSVPQSDKTTRGRRCRVRSPCPWCPRCPSRWEGEGTPGVTSLPCTALPELAPPAVPSGGRTVPADTAPVRPPCCTGTGTSRNRYTDLAVNQLR